MTATPGPAGRLGPLARAVLWLIAGTGLAQLIRLAATPLLARLYTPEDFGILGAYMAVAATLASVAALRLDLAVALPADQGSARALARLGALATGGVAVLTTVVLAALGGPAAQALGAPGLASHLWWMGLSVLGGGLSLVLGQLALRTGRGRRVALSRTTQAAGRLATEVALAPLGLGAVGLVVGEAVGRLAGNLPLVPRGRGAGPERPPPLSTLLSDYRKFPLVSTWSTLIGSLALFLPPLLLLRGYGQAEAGWYLMTAQLAGAPAALLGPAIGQAWLVHAAQRRGGRLDQEVLRLAGRILPLSLAYLLALVFGAPLLFGPLLGSAWEQAGTYAVALAPMYAAVLLVAPLMQSLVILQRQGVQLVWDSVRLGWLVTIFLTGPTRGWSTTTTLSVWAGVTAAGYLVLLASLLRLLPRDAAEEVAA